MNGAVELYKACKKHGIKPILGLEAYFVDDVHDRGRALRAQPPHAARRRATRASATSSSSAPPASSRATGAARPTWTCDLLARYSEGVIALTGCLQSRFCRRIVEDNPAEARAHVGRPDAGLRPRQRLLRGPEERHRRPGQGQRGHRAHRPRGRAAAGGHRATSTTCAARTTTTTRRCSACRRSSTLAEPKLTLRHQRVLPQGLRRDGGRRSRRGPRRCPPRSRSPSAARSRSSSARC